MKGRVSLLVLLVPFMLAAQLALRPYTQNGWANTYDLPTITWALAPKEVEPIQQLLLKIDAIILRVQYRSEANQFWLKLNGMTEAPASDEFVRFYLLANARHYAFDKWGKLFIDRRFLTEDDFEIVTQLELFYNKRMALSPLVIQHPELAIQKPLVQHKAALTTIPVFMGYEHVRYQQHDALILKLVVEFNAHPSEWVGCTSNSVAHIPILTPALIKSMMIEESGGNGPLSKSAWQIDPLQVNVPGDWDEAKSALGLIKPIVRNEGTLEVNLRAGIQFLARKGFSPSGKPIDNRQDWNFSSWRRALQRYNGRGDLMLDGRTYRAAYAARILERARHPDVFVPISGWNE